MKANELADAMEIRASIRRQATSRKSVQENANDRLADQLEQAATMLRQQQAEIEALKKDNKELHAIAQRMAMAESDARKSLQWFKDSKEMNNEPVAWMSVGLDSRTVLANYKFETAIPLYTHPIEEQDESFDRTASHMAGEYVSHPVKELKNIVLASATCSCGKVMEVTNLQPVKELTDEEIEDEWFKVFKPETGIGKNLTNGVYEFAMAILRKAQEK